jgi:hypothetical protein
MKVAFILAALMAPLSAFASTTISDDTTNYLYGMKGVYSAQYAPAEWKKKYADYDLNQEFTKALSAVQQNQNLNLTDARGILMNFVYSMRDYHTSIRFLSTEAATLPFLVHGAGDHFFIVYIDRTKLSQASFPFHVGDELATFDGRETKDVVAEVQNFTIANTPATDKALAELYLTSRSGARGMPVPKGSIMIGVKKKGTDKVLEHELTWDYSPEKISPRAPTLEFSNMPTTDGPKPSSALHPIMSVMFDSLANPYGLGARQTFTPDLGVKIWESSADNTFYAYTYLTPERKLVGYLRLAGYIEPDYTKAVADFAGIITQLQSTDSLIIDQVNNPGGSVFYLYTLASMLTDQPLRTPLHHMSITQADVMAALQTKARYQGVKNDDDAKKAATADDGADGYPVDYEFARFMVSYADFLIEQWNQGHHISGPYWIGGVNRINPNKVHYTKPILLLTNHLDFSGGDFFPAIMQDNKRVKIFGARTAGAGGYILQETYANNLGVALYSVTGSIAARVDGNPIENLGVSPDKGFAYEITAEDYQNNYAPYVEAVQTAIKSLMQ